MTPSPPDDGTNPPPPPPANFDDEAPPVPRTVSAPVPGVSAPAPDVSAPAPDVSTPAPAPTVSALNEGEVEIQDELQIGTPTNSLNTPGPQEASSRAPVVPKKAARKAVKKAAKKMADGK